MPKPTDSRSKPTDSRSKPADSTSKPADSTSEPPLNKATKLLTILTYILLEDPDLLETLDAIEPPIGKKREDLLDGCINLYAEQLLLSKTDNSTRGYAAFLFRHSGHLASRLVEVCWARNAFDMAGTLEWLEETELSYWQPILEHNLKNLPENLKAKPDDRSKHTNIKVKDESKALPPNPYRLLRKYLRNEVIYAPVLKNIQAKLGIVPSVEKHGSYVGAIVTTSIAPTEPVKTVESVDTTKLADLTESVEPTTSVIDTAKSVDASDATTSGDISTPIDPTKAATTVETASDEVPSSRRRRTHHHHHGSKSKPEGEVEDTSRRHRRR
ncbi:hypothetical protein MMC32_001153 [Xylographa parallela]|nr:hypothetical protein [Xylographa parallela]